MNHSNANVKTSTVIISCIITVIVTVFVVNMLMIYDKNTTITDISLAEKQMILIYPKKSIAIDYKTIDKATIACADKGGGCGLVIYADHKKYHTNYFTSSDDAKKLRDDINKRAGK